MTTNDGLRTQLEALFLDEPDMRRLEAQLARFNILEALGVQSYEIRHSAMLAWLLDPSGSHRLGQQLLGRFLAEAARAARGVADSLVEPLSIETWDLGETMVYRERHHIDLLLVNEQHRLACAVENKIRAQEHGNQLSRYRQQMERDYPDYHRLLVLLSPGNETPFEEGEAAHWVPLSYQTLCKAVEHAISAHESTISEDVLTLLRHYVDAVRRHIVEDSELRDLARKIYRRHKGAAGGDGQRGVPSATLKGSMTGLPRGLPDGRREEGTMTSGLLTLTVSPLRRVLSTIAAVNRPSMVSRDPSGTSGIRSTPRLPDFGSVPGFPAGIDDRATR